MEETMVEDELKLCVEKRENLRKSMETVKSKASDILTFTLQWTDVEENLLFVETRLENRSKELESKEIELLNRSLALDELAKLVEVAEAKVDDLEIIADRFRKEIEEKEKEVSFLTNQIESCLEESKADEMRLNQLKKSVEECMVEQRLKAGQLTEMVESLRKIQGEVSVEKERLCRTQTYSKELEEEIERKRKDLTVIGDRIVESGKQLKMVEEQVDAQQKLIALGVSSALSTVSDDKLKQVPSQAPINTRSVSRSLSVQKMAGLSQLDCEDVLMDNEIPASLSHSEVSAGLQLFPNPARSVLSFVEEALLGSNHHRELGLGDCTVKNLVVVLEELTRIPRAIDSRLQLEASKLASQWNVTMRTGTRGRVSSLEALAFLQLVVAYRLIDRINQDEMVKLALSVAHFKQAPKLFDSLGLRFAIPNVVMQLLNSRQYVPAIRFMLLFNLQTGLSPMNLLKETINDLKRSAMETRQFNPQAEDKDAGKLRDIIELIAEFKLEIDLPGDLIAKFVLSQESLNQNQGFASPVSIQPREITPQVQIQVAHMAAHGPSTSQATNFGTPSPNPQIIGVETYQPRGLTPFQGRSPQQQAAFKRPWVEPCVLRPVTRPGFEPPRQILHRFRFLG